jgi:PAS domain-containing protein
MTENASSRERLAELKAHVPGRSASRAMPPGGATAGRGRIDAALEASEVRYRRLFEAARDGILILNADTGVIIDSNPLVVPAKLCMAPVLPRPGP